ncbi:MAG: hypothetical protein FWG71_02975 [Synergistaceae bacterium]|nr:hypothetical protein [Synergistaceae bacterium]
MQNSAVTIAEETTGTERVSIFDLYASPEKIAEQLKRSGQLVLTNKEQPMAVMVNVDDSTMEDTLLDLFRLRAQKAVKAIQEASVRSGLSNMTLEEINAEINAVRAARKSR